MSPTTIAALGTSGAIAALFGLWQWSKADLRTAEAKLKNEQTKTATVQSNFDAAVDANQAWARAWAKRDKEIEAAKARAAKAERERAASAISLKQALKRIANAPTTDDGPVAPVLRTELDSLRAPAVDGRTGSADSSDQGATGVEPTPTDPGMPPAPPAS